MSFRNKLVDILKKKYKLFCAKGYANPVPLYQCVNPLINPNKYGKKFYYSRNSYPDGLCPQAEDLLKKSFLIPFNENYNDNEILYSLVIQLESCKNGIINLKKTYDTDATIEAKLEVEIQLIEKYVKQGREYLDSVKYIPPEIMD